MAYFDGTAIAMVGLVAAFIRRGCMSMPELGEKITRFQV
jgi:hypothetical protein